MSLVLSIFVGGLLLLGLAVPIAALVLRRRFSHSDDTVVRLLRNSSVPLAIQMIVRAIDWGFGAVLYRLLAPQPSSIANYEFGALIATLVLATIAEWGLNIYLTREVARDRSSIERLFGTTLLVRLVFAAIAVPISMAVVLGYDLLQAAGLTGYVFDAEGRLVMLLLALTLIPGAFSAAVTALFTATERPIVTATVGLITNVVSTLLRIGALLLGFGVIGMAWSALAATTLSAAVFAWLLIRAFGWPGTRFDLRLARSMLHAGFPLMLNALLLVVFFRFDMLIIRGALDTLSYTAYAAAYKYVGLTQILPPIVINAIFPLLARQAMDDRAALSRAYRLTVRWLLLLALPLAVVIAICAPWLLLLYGAEEAPVVELGAPALALLIWYLPLSYVNGVTQYVLIALDRARTITITFAAAAIFNFAFNALLIPRFGINAASVATVLSELVLYVPLWLVLRREIDTVPLWRVGWRAAAAALAMAGGMLLLVQWHVLAAVVIGPLIFAGVLVALGGIEDDDRRIVRRALRRAPA